MQSEAPTSSLHLSQPCRQFEFHEIETATNNFDESLVIGHGGFGKVYKGNLVDGPSHLLAAIKRLDVMSSQGASEFWTEIDMLSKLRHCHLVSLFGYCDQGKEMILVYEYMPNGTLDDHLHKLGTPLSWVRRLKICIGAARGLDYLHTGTGIEVGVIHRDVKTSNILLHERWAAKISDFGLSKIGPTNQTCTHVNTLVRGTFGYLDPNYVTTGRLTRKTDVYAFGVVLFEVLCRKRAVDGSLDEDDWGLVAWVQDSIKQGKVKLIIDSGIGDEISPKCLKGFVGIAGRCLHSNPKQRPTMAEIVFSLESVLALQEKYNSSMEAAAAGRTVFGRLLDIFSVPSIVIDAGISVEQNGDRSTRNVYEQNENNTGISTAGTIFRYSSQDEVLLSPRLKSFSLMELKNATTNFCPESVLGRGGFGCVYKGWIDDITLAASKPGCGMEVAVKVHDLKSVQGLKEWLTEVTCLGQLCHPNLVKLVGYCLEGNDMLLVYEFMRRGSLENHLFGGRREPLPWATRIKVAIGAARGLAFVNHANVIHRDFRACNILLDVEFNAKLSDFGLAKAGPTGEWTRTHVSTEVMGTYGYAAPEYVATGRLSSKSDVYGYGVVLLELLSGLRAIDKLRAGPKQHLVEWTKPYLGKKRQLFKIMDTRLEGQYPQKAAYTVATIASQCVSSEPKSRPSMSEVLASLENLEASNDVSNSV